MANNAKQMHRFLILYQMNTWHPKLIVTAEAKDLITNRLRHNALTILRRESTTTLLISHVFGWIFRCPRLLRFIWAVWALWAMVVLIIHIHHTYIIACRYYTSYKLYIHHWMFEKTVEFESQWEGLPFCFSFLVAAGTWSGRGQSQTWCTTPCLYRLGPQNQLLNHSWYSLFYIALLRF